MTGVWRKEWQRKSERKKKEPDPVVTENYVDPLITFLKPKEAALLLRVSLITLSRWRVTGEGPSYHKFGRNVAYLLKDLMDWTTQHRRQNTSQPK